MKLLNKILGLTSQKKSHHSHPGQPLEFHPVHGENVLLSAGNTIATREDGFCKAVVFTHRPVRVNEKIFIRFVQQSQSWSGSVRFGFSSHNPRQLAGSLPKYMCPDMTNKKGFWAKALPAKYSSQGSVMYFYVNSRGEVVLGVNGEDKGVFFSGVDTRRLLWAMIDVYGNSYQIEVYDPRKQLNNIIEMKNINQEEDRNNNSGENIYKKSNNKEEDKKYNSKEKVHKINQNQKIINYTEQEKTVYFNKVKEQGYHPRFCQHAC